MTDDSVVRTSKNQLSYAQARELLSGDIEGQRLPLIEFVDAQQDEIERLQEAVSTWESTYRYECSQVERLRAAGEQVTADATTSMDGKHYIVGATAIKALDAALRGTVETELQRPVTCSHCRQTIERSDDWYRCSDCEGHYHKGCLTAHARDWTHRIPFT